MDYSTFITSKFPELSAISELPQGGQKRVFKATHSTLGSVVLKIIQPNVEVLERTRREILAAEQINSPCVPQILQTNANESNPDPIWLIESGPDLN